MLLLAAAAIATFQCHDPVAIDGDTFRCREGTRVRVWGVNSPELGQPGSYEAKRSLQRFIDGGVVCDRLGWSYQRVVGRCYNLRLYDVGYFQLREGHAVEVCRYSGGFYGTCRK